MRNIEIKAKIRNYADTVLRAQELSNEECIIIKQRDTFFNVTQGRLKLRQFEDGTAELIFYDRPDTEGPKLCNYKRTTLNADSAVGIKEILTLSNGIRGTVTKVRQLYQIGQTRLHIDTVDGLGYFLELEVVLSDDQDTTFGEKIARYLMEALCIEREDLISGAYIDLL